MEVGAFEAKTHLSELLERVAKGARITITKHGRPMALLVPPGEAQARPYAEIVDGLRKLRGRLKNDGPSVRELIQEGRRR